MQPIQRQVLTELFRFQEEEGLKRDMEAKVGPVPERNQIRHLQAVRKSAFALQETLIHNCIARATAWQERLNKAAQEQAAVDSVPDTA